MTAATRWASLRTVEDLGSTLRFSFDVALDERRFRAAVDLAATGDLLGVQASDRAEAGTGNPRLDDYLRRAAREELARARATRTIAEFDRRRAARRGAR